MSEPLTRPLRLGTRGSPLALAQAAMTATALCDHHGWYSDAVETVIVQTSGDRIQDRPLAEIGGKALWTKELDRALLAGEIDFAVHSMKDVETVRPGDITIAAMLPRADVRDRLVGAASLADLATGAVLGTSSPRRAAQVRRLRPDISTVMFRGNVATRLAKLEAGIADATLLAAAGLDRLQQSHIGTAVPIDVMLPAPAQGAIGIEARANDTAMLALLRPISHADTFACVMVERAVLLALGGSCHSPIAVLARRTSEGLHVRAEILSGDGQEHVAGETLASEEDHSAASALGASLLERASPALRALFAP